MKIIHILLIISVTMILTHTTPMNLFISILLQTTALCFLMWMMLTSSWFSFILFIIYLGGLMVLFVYIVSLASNEKLIFNINKFDLTISMASMFFIYSILTDMLEKNNIKSKFMVSFNSMFNLSSLNLIVFSMMFLLFSLIVVIKICNKFEGPLKLTAK